MYSSFMEEMTLLRFNGDLEKCIDNGARRQIFVKCRSTVFLRKIWKKWHSLYHWDTLARVNFYICVCEKNENEREGEKERVTEFTHLVRKTHGVSRRIRVEIE